MLKNGFATLMALLFCGAATVSSAVMVHESDFETTDIFANPVTEGEVSRIWAAGGLLHPDGVPCCGYWHYTGEGRLLISHGTNNWDDPYYEYDMDSAGIAAGDTVELEFLLEPEHHVDGRAQYTEILVTGSNLGNSGNESRTAADVVFRLLVDFDYRMRAAFHPGTAGLAYVDLPTRGQDMTQARVVITYNESTSDWKAFLAVDGGQLRQIGSTINKARTQNTIRVTNEMAFAGGSGTGINNNERPWHLYTQAFRIYDAIETTDADPFAPADGEVVYYSDFNRDPLRWNDFFYPLNIRDLNGMFVPSPTTHAYDGNGSWVINHSGTAVYPNATIAKWTTNDMSATWSTRIRPDFTTTGTGQMANFKVDGNAASFFVGNFTAGALGTWAIQFGEGSDIFNPAPGKRIPMTVPVEELEYVDLYVTYDADTQVYQGFYAVNGGPVEWHTGGPVSQARGGGSVEYQAQVWGADTDAFGMGIDQYTEEAGVSMTPPMLHESNFNAATGTNPIDAGDVSRIWAVDGSWTGGVFGHYTYSGDGTLNLNRPAWNWDDPWFEFDIDSLGLTAADTVEMDFVFKPLFNDEARTQHIEILVTDPNLGNNGDASRASADVILRWWVDFNYRIRLGFRPSTDFTGGYTNIPQKADEMDEVRIIVTYNEDTQTWRAFYAIDGGWVREFPGSPIVKARTKSTIRVTNQMDFAGGTGGDFPGPNENERSWSLRADNMRIYDTLQTLDPDTIEYQVGDVLRHSRFDRNPNLSTDFFLPINVFDVNGMFVPSPATHAYDGVGSWVISHPGDNPLNPNANITKFSGVDDPTEWRMHLKPGFSANGIGQQYNFKVDGNAIAMYVGNYSGDPEVGTWGITFGEFDNIFAPDPGNVALQTVPAEDVDDLLLVINYNPATQQYNGYYQINGGEMQAHPANPVNYARTGQEYVESQFQVWRSESQPTEPFTIGLHLYEELYGVVTIVEPPVTQQDSVWIY